MAYTADDAVVDPAAMDALRDLVGQYNGPTGTQTANDEPKVWFGYSSHPSRTDDTQSLTMAKNNIFTWSPSEQQAWVNKLYRAGLINDPSNFDAAIAQWSSAVDFAAGQYTYGGKKVTPWDVIQDRLGLSKLNGKGNGPRTTTSTSTAAQVLSNGDADTMIKAMFQNQLGRDPDKGELSRYRSMLINHVSDNPTVTKTTQTVDAKGNSTSNTTSSGGTSESELSGMVSSRNTADPEWGAYQAATSYMGALEGLLGAGTPDLTGG